MKRIWTALLVAGLVIGCGAQQATSPPRPTPEPSVSTSPIPPPTARATAEATAIELPGGASSIPPGRYTRAAFLPRITFELGEGWFTGGLANGFFDVQQQQGTPDVIAVQFAQVARIVGSGATTTAATTAEAAAETIGQNPSIVVIGESPSKLGGLSGFTIEIENRGASTTPVLQVPAGTLGFDPERRLWISLFDTSQGILAVIVGGSVADWDHALAVAEPVLESVDIDDAG